MTVARCTSFSRRYTYESTTVRLLSRTTHWKPTYSFLDRNRCRFEGQCYLVGREHVLRPRTVEPQLGIKPDKLNPTKNSFTPGPLSTGKTVNQSMLCNLGSRDSEFLSAVSNIRHRLPELAHVAEGSYETVPMLAPDSLFPG